MKYFTNTLNTSLKNYEEYKNATEFQRSNLAFGAAGNLSRASSRRLKTIRDVNHEKYNRVCIRQVMLKIFESELFTRSGDYIINVNWDLINEIIDNCKQASVWSDEFDYHNLWFNTNLCDKLNGVIYFINIYGTKTDKKILIPKITI